MTWIPRNADQNTCHFCLVFIKLQCLYCQKNVQMFNNRFLVFIGDVCESD